MADQTDISQFIAEQAPDSSEAQISQDIVEAAADASSAQISQDMVEVGSNASTAIISQDMVEVGSAASAAIISQLTIECGRGPEAIPPADTPLGTFTVGFGGLAINWYIVPQLTDSGVELRDKQMKAVRVTGLVANANVKPYGYQPTQDINVADIEDGLNPLTTVFLTDTTEVVQSQRFQINCPNLMQHTVRVAGFWDGTGEPHRVDEIVYEVAQQGVRR